MFTLPVLALLLALSLVSLGASLFSVFRSSGENAFTSFACSIAALALAVWVIADVLPGHTGPGLILSSLVLSSLVANTVFWARSGIQAKRRSSAVAR